MNTRLQVSSFLGALSKSFSKQFLVLILTPDQFLPHWHFHLMKQGGLKVEMVKPDTCPNEFYEETNLALLLSFTDVKLARCLVDCNFFSVVIDSFDTVAQKLAIKKLESDFNIGLTSRNFYTEPDQKLQWSMLNWSNPGVFGKLADFYETDDDNFASYRNSYKTWWFRLTWQFCESFKPYTHREKNEYNNAIEDWKITYPDLQELDYVDICGKVSVKHEKRSLNNNTRTHKKGNENLFEAKKEKVTYKSRGKNKKTGTKIKYGAANKSNNTKIVKNEIELSKIKDEISDSDSSADTIIYEDCNPSSQNLDQPNIDEISSPPLLIPFEKKATNEESDTTLNINLKHQEEIKESQDSDRTSLEKDLLLSLIDEPAKKRRRTNEEIKDNVTPEFQNSKTDHDDLLLSLLPKNGFLKDKVIDSIFEHSQKEDVQKKDIIQNFTLNLDLEVANDIGGEADTFLHSLIKSQSNLSKSTSSNNFKFINKESSKSHDEKIGKPVDLKKLEEMLRETDTY